MIIKGGSHTGKGLGDYLLQDKNERAEVWGIRGDIPRDLGETLDDWRSDVKGSKTTKPLYHAQLNPDRALTREEWEQAIALFEKEMGFSDQPRAIVLHEYKGREHLHLVYSRIGEDGKAIPDNWNYLHHEKAAREIEQELGLEPTQGTLYRAKEQPRPERTPSHDAIQQGERTKLDPKAVKTELTALYREAEGNAPAFLSALKEHGYSLARGDKRGFVVLDGNGGVHSLTRATGAKAGELRELLKDCHDLPSVDEAKAELPRAEEIPEPSQAPEITPETAEAKPEPAPERETEPSQEPEETHWQDRINAEGETEGSSGGGATAPITTEEIPDRGANSSITDPLNISLAKQITTRGEVQHKGLIKSWVEHALDWAYELGDDFAYAWEVLKGNDPDLPNIKEPAEPEQERGGFWQRFVGGGKTAEPIEPKEQPPSGGDPAEPPAEKKHFWQRFVSGGKPPETPEPAKEQTTGEGEPSGNRFQQLTKGAREAQPAPAIERPRSGLDYWRNAREEIGEPPERHIDNMPDDLPKPNFTKEEREAFNRRMDNMPDDLPKNTFTKAEREAFNKRTENISNDINPDKGIDNDLER